MTINIFFILSLIILTSLFDTVNQLFLKNSINSVDLYISSIGKIFQLIIKLIRIPQVWFGFIFSTLSLLIWLFVLSKVDLNFAFSADSMHYIFIAFASRLFLKEKVGVQRWIGTMFIVMGIILITWSNK